MNRKIYLVQPAYRDRAGKLLKGNRIPYGSLALPAVSAAVPPDWEKEFCLEYFEDVRWDTDASVVGITSMGYDIIHGYEIADEFRRQGKQVIFGGPQAWLCPAATGRHADSVVLGHPSPPEMAAILEDALHRRLAPEYRCGMSADYPFDYTAFSHARMDLMPVTTSLGCRGACSFCCISALYRGACRLRGIECVLADLRSARARSRRVVFVDANIYGRRDHLLRLCRLIREERLGLQWAAQCTVDLADDAEALDAMREAGCLLLIAGFESLAQGSLARCGKPFSAKEHAARARRIRDAGIALGGYFMLGLEDDTQSSFGETYDFIRASRVSLPILNLLLPAPGTRTWEQLKAEGRLLVGSQEEYEQAIDSMLSSTVCSRCFYVPRLMTVREAESGFLELYRKLTTYRQIFHRSMARNPVLTGALLSLNLAMRRDYRAMARGTA